MLSGGRLAKKRNSNAQISQKVFGFTLAELLVILLISSIIMVVLAPVVRKKQTAISGNASSSAKYENILYTTSSPPSECSNSSDNTVTCNFKVPKGVKFLNAIMVSGGGGGAGATNPNITYGNVETLTTASTKTVNIFQGMRNVYVLYLSGGGGGGGAGAYTQSSGGGAPKSQADCDKYDAKFLTAAQNGGTPVCVTKWNIGDIPDAPNGGIASSVTTVSTGSYCDGYSTNGCCWQGKTAEYCDSYRTSYSGCNRTVCTWYAGNASCQALAYNGTKAGDWRLPTENELSKWASNIKTINKNQGDNGLRLCDIYSGDGAAQCHYYDVCDGSIGNCYPYYVWSSTAYSSGYYYGYYLSSGSFGWGYSDPQGADSVRCVLEAAGPSNISLSGGGGGGAPYISNYIIPQNIIDSAVGGRIVMSSGAGGTGKSSGDGNDGSESYIYVYNSSNTLVWGLKAPGGKGGKGATTTSFGSGGAQNSLNSCQIYNGTSWSATNCTSAGTAGTNGTKVEGANETTAATGGTGGGASYVTSNVSGGGAGGSASSVNGGSTNNYGAGGGGATVGFDSSGNPKEGTGGTGANGVASIAYDSSYQAASGGGGAGGSYAILENLPVIPEKTYTIKVGNSGNGGAVNRDGADGGVSSISFEGGTYTLGGGGAGKVGTAGTQTSAAIHGLGGAVGATNIPAKLIKLGEAGSAGQQSGAISIGGLGGKSGINTKGGCGGFSTDADCTNPASQGNNTPFAAPTTPNTTKQFGSAGSGGGGGGWKSTSSSDSGPGGGASGQSGYVYIYWIRYE